MNVNRNNGRVPTEYDLSECIEAEELFLMLYHCVHKKDKPRDFWKYKDLSEKELWNKAGKFLALNCP